MERSRSGQGPGWRACTQPPRPPPPSTHLLSARQSTSSQNPHTSGRRQNGSPSRRPAGARAPGPSPPRLLTRPALTHQRGARDVRSPDQAVLFPHVGGAHLTQRPRPAHPTELPQDPRADTMAATRGGGAGGGSDTPPLGLGHLTDNPERSRSTAKAQAEPALAQCPRGQRDGPAGQHPHRRGGGPPARRQPQEAKARGACCVGGPHRPPPDATRQTAGAGQRGRAGFRTPVPPNAPPTGGEERQGGPRGRDEKNGSHSP